MFTMAITWVKASGNPVKEVKLYRENNGKIRFLTEEEETRLLAHCSPTLKPIVITGLYTGFRKSEVLSLTWANVDFQHRLITVGAAYAKNRETRSVPMTLVLTETLQAIRISADQQAPVFLNSKGTPYRDISTAFQTAVRRAGLRDVSFHTTRHTFASRLVMRGVDLKTVQELMGHKHITMTLKYAHLAPGHKRAAIAVLDQSVHEVPSEFPTVANTAISRLHKLLKT
jgi:integrase